MAADFIVYSIAEGGAVAEAQQALDFLKMEAGHFLTPKCFILVSICLTWNTTKPLGKHFFLSKVHLRIFKVRFFL